MINNFERKDNSLYLNIRASVDEINNTMRGVYGPFECVEENMNFKAFEFENVRVQYIKNHYLTATVLSQDKKELDKLEKLIGKF